MRYVRGWGLGAPVERGETPPFSGSTTLDDWGCARGIGQAAQRLIAQDCSGQVLAVVAGAIYLLTEDGEVCWLAQSHLPMHARAISAPFNATRARQGMRFLAQNGRVELGGKLFIDCATAAMWEPSAMDADRVACPNQVLGRVRQLRERVECRVLPDQASSAVHDIELACQERDFAKLMWSCQDLIGMGPGLTPSGDDFVGGLIFTLYYLHAVYPDLASLDPRLVHSLLDYARTRTVTISYCLLCDHAEGQGVEPLHHLLADILSEEDRCDPAESARQVVGIGNTSGTALLAGALTAMEFLDHRGDSDDN